jgi:hypothetical protein
MLPGPSQCNIMQRGFACSDALNHCSCQQKHITKDNTQCIHIPYAHHVHPGVSGVCTASGVSATIGGIASCQGCLCPESDLQHLSQEFMW